MSGYTSFAVVGTGFIGLAITKALVDQKASVVVLTRALSKPGLDLGDGVKVASVDYGDNTAIIRVLEEHHVQVIISALGTGGLSVQNAIADASKAAGVKLFVPSEFGLPTEGAVDGVFAVKNKSAEYIQSIGVPTARFYNGFFTERSLNVVGYTVNKKVNILDGLKGETPISFTGIEDAAGFVAHVLTRLHPAELDNQIF
ncbi:hypothetical protein H0H81_007777 [Sphagnurus paluster]|uniref:NmrA-like domain-containing protein n=1 Tax=Sphagnurus paluster TaxID=117069 RepID=A0A9P7GPZ3_9AGAR|nr:hypothetical protein H0H81_007777 [Sphagnurus paluster]